MFRHLVGGELLAAILLQLLELIPGHADCGNLHLRAIGGHIEELVVRHGSPDLDKLRDHA